MQNPYQEAPPFDESFLLQGILHLFNGLSFRGIPYIHVADIVSATHPINRLVVGPSGYVYV